MVSCACIFCLRIKYFWVIKQEQQRVAVVDPGTRILCPFARCRPTRLRYAAAAATAEC